MQHYNRSQRDVQRFGLLGGTFDPIHYGHLVIAEEVRTALDLTEMVFVPAGYPPHKPQKTISETRHRVAMVELAIASNPHFSISTVDIERPGHRIQWKRSGYYANSGEKRRRSTS